MSIPFLLLLITAYVSGSIPWSVWLSKFYTNTDPRTFADGNPGAANAFRAGGWRLGVLVLLLDFFKAFIPVFIARWLFELPGHQLFWIAIAPTIGHAFSMFLHFRGGRALVTMFGSWSGITLYELPLIMGLGAIGASFVARNDELKSVVIPLIALVYLLLINAEGWMIALTVTQLGVLLLKIGSHMLHLGLTTRKQQSM